MDRVYEKNVVKALVESFDDWEKLFRKHAEVWIARVLDNLISIYSNDDESIVMARDIRKRIEQELEYPGQIKVICVRETRAVEYAK